MLSPGPVLLHVQAMSFAFCAEVLSFEVWFTVLHSGFQCVLTDVAASRSKMSKYLQRLRARQ